MSFQSYPSEKEQKHDSLPLLNASWKRIEANMIACPTWVLNRRAFAAATGAARASA
jgi:hypothetical protein